MTTHDLLAPLRKLGVLTDKFLEKAGDNPELQDYANRIHRSLEEMRAAITGYRLIAEATAESLQPEEINSRELIEGILREKTRSVPETRFELGELPNIVADRKQVTRLFEELLENAFVFRKKGVPLVLDISARPLTGTDETSGSYWEFKVKDNGIGFHQKDAEIIFDPTIRLNGKSAYPGNGLGLTLAKKIVSNHKGRIYAESTKDEGCCLTVILPQRLN